MSGRVLVSEVFGPVIQGEGPLIGRPTVFVRTGGCDSRCRWCDTPYAVLPEHAASWASTEPAEVLAQVRRLAPAPILVTLSGGNPALQAGLGEVVALGREEGYSFACETQATVPASWFRSLDHLVLSPKPPSSGEPENFEAVRRCLDAAELLTAVPGYSVLYRPHVSLKVVVLGDPDYQFARRLGAAFPDLPLFLQVCNPLGPEEQADVADLLTRYRVLASRVLADRWADVAVLPQLHVLAWGAERGR